MAQEEDIVATARKALDNCTDTTVFEKALYFIQKPGMIFDHAKVRRDVGTYRRDRTKIPPYVQTYIAWLATPRHSNAIAA